MGTSATVLGLSACTPNTELQRQQLLLVSDAQLQKMSESAWLGLKQKGKIAANPIYMGRVQRVGSKIAPIAGLNPASLDYVLLEDSEPNAFVLPGGKVGVHTGLFEVVRNDHQLAAVLGHEMGHVIARHAAERVSQGQAVKLASALGQMVAGQVLPDYQRQIGTALGLGTKYGVLLPYSRRHETEADRLGVQYMAQAGYNPREAITLWQNMSAHSKQSRPPEFLSTHPSPATRLRDLEQMIQGLGY